MANGMAQGRTFDSAGRETQRRVRYNNQFGAVLALQYDATYDKVNNRLRQVELDGSVTSYSYDATNQLLTEWRTDVTPANSFRLTYTYDNLGNRLSLANGSGLTTYSYDAANQLNWRQNPDGSVTSYTYDASGNRAGEQTGTARTTYTWDYENRMSGIAYPGGGIETFTYAADGMRRKKVDSSGTTNFVWDGVNVLQEKDASLITTAHYTGQPDNYEWLVSQRRSGVSQFAVSDLQFSIRALFPSGQQPTSDTYLKTAFGVPVASTGSTVNPYQFEGLYGYYTDSSGLVYVRARYYDSVTGTWMSVDPLGFDGGDWNLWRYVGNGPVVGVDAGGLFSLKRTTGQVLEVGWDFILLRDRMGAAHWAYEQAMEISEAAKYPWNEDLPGGVGGPQDAFRHCLWQCLLTQVISDVYAQAVGDCHEWKNNFVGDGTPDQEKMDKANNLVGRQIGKSGQSCDKSCMDALIKGRLFGLNGIPLARPKPPKKKRTP